jgi:hypothetical protein
VNVTNTKTAQLRMRRSQRIRVLHPLTNAFDMRYVVLLVFAVIAMVLAFQSPPAVDIAVGSLGDRLFLQSSAGLGAADADKWYGDELSSDAASGRSRWTRQVATVEIPLFDTTSDISLMVRVAGWPANVKHGALTQPRVTIQVNGTTTTVFTPTTDFADYYFVLPATLGRDSALQIKIQSSDVFTQTTSGADIRPKGVRVERIAAAIRQPGGEQAVQLKVAERAVDAYSRVATDASTTLIVPSNMSEVSALIASAMKMVQVGK